MARVSHSGQFRSSYFIWGAQGMHSSLLAANYLIPLYNSSCAAHVMQGVPLTSDTLRYLRGGSERMCRIDDGASMATSLGACACVRERKALWCEREEKKGGGGWWFYMVRGVWFGEGRCALGSAVRCASHA